MGLTKTTKMGFKRKKEHKNYIWKESEYSKETSSPKRMGRKNGRMAGRLQPKNSNSNPRARVVT